MAPRGSGGAFEARFLEHNVNGATWLLDESGRRIAWLGGGETIEEASASFSIRFNPEVPAMDDPAVKRALRQWRTLRTEALRHRRRRGRPPGPRLIAGYTRRTHEQLAADLGYPRIDILASNTDATKAVGIQVKTGQRGTPNWILAKKAERDVAENLFYVFVCLPAGQLASFYIVPRRVVGQYLRDDHQRWLTTPGRRGQAHRDSDVRVFRDPVNAYKDRWDLLGLD